MKTVVENDVFDHLKFPGFFKNPHCILSMRIAYTSGNYERLLGGLPEAFCKASAEAFSEAFSKASHAVKRRHS